MEKVHSDGEKLNKRMLTVSRDWDNTSGNKNKMH